jgi:hypothetical protein
MEYANTTIGVGSNRGDSAAGRDRSAVNACVPRPNPDFDPLKPVTKREKGIHQNMQRKIRA